MATLIAGSLTCHQSSGDFLKLPDLAFYVGE
jgi:hypothetical protein